MPFKRSFLGLIVLVLACYSGCASAPKVENEVFSVAVWDLVNYNQPGTDAPDLGDLLAARIIETLKDSGAYQVIERERLILLKATQKMTFTTNVFEWLNIAREAAQDLI